MKTLYPTTIESVSRGLSPRLWGGMPLDQIFGGPNSPDVGYGIWDDFIAWPGVPATNMGNWGGQWRAYVDTAMTCEQYLANYLGVTGGVPGKGIAAVMTTTDNLEVWLQAGGTSTTATGGAPFVLSDTPLNCRKLCFEVRFLVTTITTLDAGWFLGLGEPGMAVENTIADAGTLVSKDFIGLFKPEANTTGVDIVYDLAGAAAVNTHADDFQTIAINTWYKFGFMFEPMSHLSGANEVSQVRFFWNGVEDTAHVLTHADITNAVLADFPDAQPMHVLLGQKSGNTGSDAWLKIDWVCCAQLE